MAQEKICKQMLGAGPIGFGAQLQAPYPHQV